MDHVIRIDAGVILNYNERLTSNLKDSPRGPGSNALMNSALDQKGGGGDNCQTPPLKMSSPRGTDNQSTDTKLSGDTCGALSAVTISPRHKDPDRIKKDREREERVRQARERLEEERKKKLIELQEQQRQAQENREKQLEMRRKKIEDLRRREMERRTEVEKRRREKENAEKSRRETLLLKAEERVARYEAWKRGGQKGGRGHVLGFGSATPRSICQPMERQRRSSSHSGLLRHSPSGSDSDYSFRPQRRALSACSTVRRHCCVDLNRSGPPPGSAMPTAKHLSVSTSVLYHKRHSDFSSSSGALNVSNRPDSLMALNTIPEGRRSVLAPSNLSTSRPKSTMSLSTSSAGSTSGPVVRLREHKSPRKPRPASVATSMPSFVNADSSKVSSTPRSKSTDRLARERSRPRGAGSASRAENSNKEEEEEGEKKTSDKPGVKMSRKTLERLSTPRQVPTGDGDRKDSSSTPRREPNLVRTSPRKAYSTSNLAMPRQKSSLREKTSKESPGRPLQPKPKDTAIKPHKPKDTPKDKTPQHATLSAPSPITAAPAASTSPRASSPASRTPSHTPVRVLSPTPGADEDGGSGTSQARSTPTPGEKSTVETSRSTPTPGEKSTVETSRSTPTPGEKSTVETSRSTPTPVEKSTVETPRPTHTSTPAETSGAEGSQSFSTPTTAERSTGDITAEEYKARLAEKRRQAREKAEKEAEEERKRKEEEERLEEERRQQEEEEQKKREEEAVRLAEEARRAEEERLQRAIEAEEARKAEEAARLEQERLAKEEAERKAREEAERLEQERQEKSRREEEERLERKKRLEMIMKRVKTDNTGEGVKDSPRSVSSSPARSAAPPVSSENATVEGDGKVVPTVTAETEERKRSTDGNAEESRSPVIGGMSPVNAPSPVPPATQETTPMPQSSSQENMLEAKEDYTPTSSRSASPVVSAMTTPRAQSSAAESGADKPKFKSPLLQKLVEGKDDSGYSAGDGPRFKSPLLQNILSKTRMGARMGLAQDYSRSSPDLSQVDVGSNGRGSNVSPPLMAMSASMINMDTVNSASKEELNVNEEKDVDTSEDTSSSTHSTPGHQSRKHLMANGEGVSSGEVTESSVAQDFRSIPGEALTSVDSSAAPEVLTTSGASLWNAQDSGVSLGSSDLQSSAPSMMMSLNGHAPAVTVSQGQGLEDSSISMQSVDSVNPALADSPTESTPPPRESPRQQHFSEDKIFEELIDLSISNNSSSTTTTTTSPMLNKSEELVSFNKLEEGSEGSPALPPPIIAFEETSLMKHQDVSDLLS